MTRNIWHGLAVTVGMVMLLVVLPLLGACTKEVVKEVPVEKVVAKEVVKEVPVEKVVEKEVVKEVPVEKVVVKEVPVEKVFWTYACSGKPADESTRVKQEYINDAVKRSNGQLEVKFLTAVELPYSATEYLRLTRDGVIQIADIPGISVAGVEPAVNLPDLPLALDEKELETYQRVSVPYVIKTLEDKWNVKVITSYHLGPREVMVSKPATSLKDLQGRRIRVAGGIEPILAKSWGVAPVTILWPEVYPALQRGIADGLLTATTPYMYSKLYEVAPYFVKADLHVVTFYLCANRDAWNALSPSAQKALVDALGEFDTQWNQRAVGVADDAALDTMVKAGQVKDVIDISHEEKVEFRNKSLPLLRQYVQDKVGAEGIAAFDEVLKALQIQ